MKIEEYLQLIYDGKKEEAEKIRLSTIPDKLIKFIWLDGSEIDNKKFASLKNEEIWFAQKDILNDPYEYKGILINRSKMKIAGYSEEFIDKCQTLLDFSDYGITCLSGNKIDYLPMWAYYTNNHRGFCIEYDIINKNCIHEVLYEPERIKVASLLVNGIEDIKKTIVSGKRGQSDFYMTLLLQNLFIKAKSWEHEKEYRIVYSLNGEKGLNVPIHKLGMKMSRIVVGINCTEDDLLRLNKISNELGLGNAYRSRVHPERYTIDFVR